MTFFDTVFNFWQREVNVNEQDDKAIFILSDSRQLIDKFKSYNKIILVQRLQFTSIHFFNVQNHNETIMCGGQVCDCGLTIG